MNPSILLVGFLLFGFSMLMHVVVWRKNKPRDEIAALLTIFLGFPLLLSIPLIYLPSTEHYSLYEWSALYLLVLALAGVYISTYPAVQAYSPSLEILMKYRGAKDKGYTQEDFLNCFNKKQIIIARIQELENSKWVKRRGKLFELTLVGKWIIYTYIYYRKALGLTLLTEDKVDSND